MSGVSVAMNDPTVMSTVSIFVRLDIGPRTSRTTHHSIVKSGDVRRGVELVD
jgi:hypothetical protein